jgi:hypothetical protein
VIGLRREGAELRGVRSEANTYTRLPSADLEPVGMNFIMTWDSHNRVVFLVTGDHSGVVTVWAMRPARHDAR